MTTATILSWVLAFGAPPVHQTPTLPDLETVEFERSDDSVQITARDAEGEVAAEVIVWADLDGRMRLDAAWPDGLYLAIAGDGEDATVNTEDATEAARRIELLDVAIQEASGGTASPTAEDWEACAMSAMLVLAACVVHPILCAYEMYAAGCHCLPKIVEEWEGEEC